MTLSSRISSLTGPDRAVDALLSAAKYFRLVWTVLSVVLLVAGLWMPDGFGLIACIVFTVGGGIAHLFALLAAAMQARGL